MGEDQDGEYGGICGSQKRHVIKPKPKAQSPRSPKKAKLWAIVIIGQTSPTSCRAQERLTHQNPYESLQRGTTYYPVLAT
jgi:hypothetical protein